MSAFTNMPLTLLALLSGAALIMSHRTKKRKAMPLPPGPPPLPIVGNVRGFNVNAPWLTYTEWAAAYGDLVYSRLFNQDIIVVNSEEVASALLDQRSHIYSDRPELVTNELLGLSFNSVFLRYGPKWRFHRRLFHQVFKQDAALSYRPMQLRKAHQLLRGLLEDPQDYEAHIRLHSSAIILSAVYDYDPAPREDPLIAVIEKAVTIAIEVQRPEVAAIFNTFPILLSLPSWFPGLSIKRAAVESRQYATRWLNEPFQYAQDRMRAGTSAPSMVSDALGKWDNNDDSGDARKAIKEAAATAFIAASETTASTMNVFVLAMVLYPEVQERAQALIDSVVGTGRLPNFEDRALLTYIDAIIRETFRWHPIVPMGVPHATYDEDVYEGYYIPKGAMVLPNVWAMTHNEEKYPNPDEFIPERFLTADGSLNDDTSNFAFGFGRRICVGRHVADASLWSAMALMLAVFRFTKAKDEEGNDIDFEPKWFAGLATHPLPFPCSITPRLEGMNMKKLNALIEESA